MHNLIIRTFVQEGVVMMRLLNLFSNPDVFRNLKYDYISFKKMQLITYDGLWCLKENDALLLLEERGTGG